MPTSTDNVPLDIDRCHCYRAALGRLSAPDRRRCFAIARGSALECAAVFDVLRLRSAVSAEAYLGGRRLLVRLVQMLSRMSAQTKRPA